MTNDSNNSKSLPAVQAPPRLPMPANAGVDVGKWRVLCEAIFPNARSPGSIMLALEYCAARGLDVMKKPVNIVPMWNTQLGKYVETVWPSINEIQVTAARTREWAGMDPPVWGNLMTQSFTGQPKNSAKRTINVTFPESCEVTVYRLVNGHRCAFSEPVYWLEAYGRIGGTELPNDMWAKRARGQLHKVAKAASLRAAFPEEGDHTDEEMEGQTLDPPEPVDVTPVTPSDNWQGPPAATAVPPGEAGGGPAATAGDPREEPPPNMDNVNADHRMTPDHDPDTGEVGPRELPREDQEEWRDWCQRLLAGVRSCVGGPGALAEVDKWMAANKTITDALNAQAPKIHIQLMAAVGRHKVSLAKPEEGKTDGEPTNVIAAG